MVLAVRGVEEGCELSVHHAAAIAEHVEDDGVVEDVVLGKDVQKTLSHLADLVRLEKQRLCWHNYPHCNEPAGKQVGNSAMKQCRHVLKQLYIKHKKVVNSTGSPSQLCG